MKLYFCRPTQDYCDFLHQYDNKVANIANDKAQRPFIGIIFQINQFDFYAPLTSPKPKHKTMHNQIDFLKINNGDLGAINFNNMIPISEDNITKVNFKILPNDTLKQIAYKNLLKDQFDWCNSNKNIIRAKAEKLYNLIIHKKAFPALQNRCCDFKKLEQMMLNYSKINNIEIQPNISQIPVKSIENINSASKPSVLEKLKTIKPKEAGKHSDKTKEQIPER